MIISLCFIASSACDTFDEIYINIVCIVDEYVEYDEGDDFIDKAF